MDDCDFLIKIVLVGDERTGKSAFLARFADDEFVSEYVTTAGVDFKIRLMTVDDRKIKFQIWDVSDKFSVLDRSQGGNYRGAHGIMLIYDSTNSNSFESLKSKWLREATQHASSQTIKMIVATKCDLPSTVSSSRLRTFCESIGATYMETSAKTGSNVDAAFIQLAREYMRLHAAVPEIILSSSNASLPRKTSLIKRLCSCCFPRVARI